MDPIEIIKQKQPHFSESIIKILHLPLKKQWFELIESGIKQEEYREIKPYWINRIVQINYKYQYDPSFLLDVFLQEKAMGIPNKFPTLLTHVCFSLGYTNNKILFSIEQITCGIGKEIWGAPNHEVFIIKLGQRLY